MLPKTTVEKLRLYIYKNSIFFSLGEHVTKFGLDPRALMVCGHKKGKKN